MSKRTSLSRRDFVKHSAALAVAAPTVISATALGNDKVDAPSERLTLGFIGIGKQASGHLGALSGRRDTNVLAVCDVHTLRRKAAAETVEKKYVELERKDYKGCTQYTDFHELLGRKDIDAVVIGVPDHWHTIPVIEACKAKKDIYCEKPLTLTIHEAKTVIEAVRKHDRVFQTGSQQRSEGPFRQACEYIRNGRLGKIKEVHIGVGATSKPCDLPTQPTDPNVLWDVWLGQAPERGYNEILCRKGLPNDYPFNPGWRDYREFSGGYITDWGAHHFDITQWALDMDHSGPVEILPPEKPDDKFGARFIYRGSPVGDEIVCTHVEQVYEGYKTVVEKGSKEAKREKFKESNGILFIGEKGRIFVNRGVIISEPDDILKTELSVGDKKLFKSPGHRENWLDCIKTRQKPICDVEIGARSVTVCHLVNLAYWHGKKLQWDPAKWEFPGDAEANGWRDRARREKYQLPEV
ncbi:MAG TPA: Gfo/Idh/MocA family oxidoreductase [Tepidisphaeraceae bacterium]|jgi:predicted dehydrogenase|nr:Gfo/Idh/MocA family oxidoreductase [Tepidisphaeraceae bacterium]